MDIDALEKTARSDGLSPATAKEVLTEVRRLQALVGELKSEFGSISSSARRAERERCAKAVEDFFLVHEAGPMVRANAVILAERIRTMPDESCAVPTTDVQAELARLRAEVARLKEEAEDRAMESKFYDRD